MNKLLQALLTVIVAVTASWLVAGHAAVPFAHTQSVYERVLASGTLRCGYFEEAPFTIIDPNTGKKSGIAVELAEKVAAELSLKVEWVGAISWGTLGADLENGRYDAICGSLFNLPRAGRVGYTIPYTYVPVYAYTQYGRTEFDNKFDTLDWSKITVAGLDGEGSTTIALKKLPQAKFNVLPQTSQIAEMLTSVADKKADMGFVMPTVFKNFDKANPGRLQKIQSDKPFYVFNVSFGVKTDEPAFKNMLDFVMRNLASDGTLQNLFDKYDPDGLLFRPAALYRAASN